MHNGIDVIIPTYNRLDIIAGIAASVAAQLQPGDMLYIVWQGNKPDIDEKENIRCIPGGKPNLPRARNCGIAAGKNPLILMLDDDIEVSPTLLEEHRRVFTDESIAAVAGYIEDPVYDSSRQMPSFLDMTTGQLVQNFSFPVSCFSLSAPGGNMSFRRRAAEAVGNFDKNFTGNALWEEIDFSLRLRQAGYKIWFCSSARLRHLRHPRGGCRQQSTALHTYRLFANTAYFAARFAPASHYRSWLRYWKYRVEFISRTKTRVLRHNPIVVLSAIAGACEGLLRYVISGRNFTNVSLEKTRRTES